MVATLRRTADRLIHLAAVIGAVALIVELGVILVDVVGRYFGAPLTGAQDISTMTLAVLVFGAMALCDRTGGHISVDVFERRFPEWLNRAGDIVGAALGAAVFAGIAWTVWESAGLSQMLNLRTNIIDLPKWWFQWAVVVFSVITALGMVLRFVELCLGGPRPAHDLAESGE
ncbi:TRAP transporter small permease [Tranquillimonas alkanivorans]|uniref:TRAP transporter small permease protein n=1 Tax=Tranquillimonas alkanivorans TaxID=441119 RepID=A0A1I5N9R8_9RHOB|nr:TRAP transporter small permease [Tranquillimonas alkanivorans]SFP18447.1 TRAP-type C4-dicarboxylate transport system, small permease component [Tranquillimonas alkanivorans]